MKNILELNRGSCQIVPSFQPLGLWFLYLLPLPPTPQTSTPSSSVTSWTAFLEARFSFLFNVTVSWEATGLPIWGGHAGVPQGNKP